MSDPLFCAVCHQQITGKYLYNHWQETVHVKHQGVKTAQCSTCARFISGATQNGIRYGDGRVVCGICQVTAVTEEQKVEHARRRVLEMLTGAGFDYIPDYIAVTLTDQRRLQQKLGRHGNSYGLTKTLEKKENGVLVYREHSIFVLYGLPRLVFEGVLAHELLHVWLNERPESRERTPAEVEGFCNLASALIYGQEQTPMAQYLLERLHSDPDPVYGDGYRQQQAFVQRHGWQAMREHMLRPAAPLKQMYNKLDGFLNRFNL